MDNKSLMPQEKIDRAIILIRGKKVMIDSDLADIYGVETKRLNEQVKRNIERFPDDFMFQITSMEKSEVVAICDHLKKLKFSSVNPYAFTEHGAIMLASVLNSPRAIQVSVLIVRAFVRLRQMMESNSQLKIKIEEMERSYDEKFKIVFQAIKSLVEKRKEPRKQIGFRIKKD